MCPDGLLVLYKGQLVLVDPETLLPKRMVVEKVENGKRFLGAPRIKHLIRVQYVSDDGLQVASYDPVTGKDIDTWSMDDHETTERAMRGASFAQLSPDGRHLIIGGRPGLHLEFDEAGKIVGQQKIAMPVEDKIAMPVPMFSSRAVAFYQFAAGVRSFICEMSDTSKMALASDQQVPWLYDDRSSLFWSVDRSGKLIGYDREGKEKIILEHEVFAETLKHYNPSHLATAPPGGGHLLLSSAGTLWVELPKL